MKPSQPEKGRTLQAKQGANPKLTTMRKTYPRIGKRATLAATKLRLLRLKQKAARREERPHDGRKGGSTNTHKEG